MSTKESVKQALHQQCLTIAEERIEALQQIISETQLAANNETKSSSGDKHETGRAMAQLEIEKLAIQLRELQNIKEKINQINPNLTGKRVVLGSVIYTDKGNFYLSASIGQVNVENTHFYAISLASPMGRELIGKNEGEQFLFNGSSYTLLAVF